MITVVARRWPLLRVLLTAHLSFVAVAWVLFTVVIMVITGIVALAAGISNSVLHEVAVQAPRWLMFGLAIDVVHTYLRIQLAHGRTRRDFLGQAIAYTVVLSGFTAVLITIGYLLERGYYAVFGWSQRLSREGVLATADEYAAILGSFWLSFLMWTVAGLVIGLGFYRTTGLGLLTIPLSLVIVLPTVAMFRTGGLPVVVSTTLTEHDITTGVLVAACAGLFVVAVGIAWALVRHVPMRPTAP